MTAETNIIIAHRDNALLVPATAVQGDKVLLVRNGQLTATGVEPGARGPAQIEIRSGIGPEDLIVTNPDPSLKNGEKVTMRIAPARASQ